VKELAQSYRGNETGEKGYMLTDGDAVVRQNDDMVQAERSAFLERLDVDGSLGIADAIGCRVRPYVLAACTLI
jgi:hypothetical protein